MELTGDESAGATEGPLGGAQHPTSNAQHPTSNGWRSGATGFAIQASPQNACHPERSVAESKDTEPLRPRTLNAGEYLPSAGPSCATSQRNCTGSFDSAPFGCSAQDDRVSEAPSPSKGPSRLRQLLGRWVLDVGRWRFQRRDAALRSALYECDVMHHRLEPKEHHFRYRIFMFALDLDEIDEVAERVLGFGRNRRSIYEFRDRDHLTLPELGDRGSLREHFVTWLDKNGIQLPASSRIMLVTLPRVFGYIFNPVSFYFCEDAQGRPICAVVQVGNTFGEQKPYLLREPSGPGAFRLITPKHFYVSPFSELDLCFDFKLKVPGEYLDIHIDDRAGDRRVLLSALTGRRAPLTSARLAWLTLKYPLITVKVIFLIHWHALLLWWKRLPWHRKAANTHLQRDVYRPHASIASKHT